MADFAATAGKTDDMTHANAKIVPPARHENRMAARAYALVMRWLVRLAALITVAILVFLIGYILVTGIPHLKPSLFQWNYTSENVSMMPAILTTVETTALALLLASTMSSTDSASVFSILRSKKQGLRDAFRHSVHRIRPVRNAVFRHQAALGILAAGRCDDAGDHDPAAHHAYR